MIRVDAAAEDDVPAILDIEHESFSPPWPHGALLSEVFSEDSFFAVARRRRLLRRSSPVVGFIILRRFGDDGELMQIAVDTGSRRQGIADILMDAAFRQAAEWVLTSVFLEVRKSNEAAVALYEKHGFEPVRIREAYYSDPTEDAVVMMRRW